MICLFFVAAVYFLLRMAAVTDCQSFLDSNGPWLDNGRTDLGIGKSWLTSSRTWHYHFKTNEHGTRKMSNVGRVPDLGFVFIVLCGPPRNLPSPRPFDPPFD